MMGERETEARGLAGLPATRRQRMTALLLGALLLLLTGLLLPWVTRPLPHLPAFLPTASSITLFADAVTALLLLAQLRRERTPGLAVLAAAYLFNSLIIIPYLLAFPGAFAPGGLFGAGSQATAWLWQCWHASLPLGLLVYAGMETRRNATRLGPRQVRRALTLALVLPTVLTVAVTACIVVGAALLPPLAQHGRYTALTTLWLGPLVCVLAALACASVALRTREHTIVQVWLGLAALAEFLDVLLGTMGGARYTLGWYASRLDSLVAAGIALAGVAYAVGHLDAWLIDSEERFRGAFDRSAIGMMMTALDGRFLRVNDAFCHMLGYSRQELLALTFMDVTHPDDVAGNVEGAERVRAGSADSYTTEKRYRRNDGGLIWVSLSVSLMRAPSGAPLHYICQVADITARQEAEETLREDALRLAGVVATQRDIALAGQDLSVVMPLIARRAQDLTRADGAVIELIEGGELVYRAASGTMAEHLGTRMPIDGTIAGLSVHSGETLYCADTATDQRTDPETCGRLGIGSMIVVPLRHGGDVVGVLKVAATATEAFTERAMQTLQLMAGLLGATMGQSLAFTALRHSEEALRTQGAELERSNAELQQFAYVASHDLQEPLRTIQSYLGLLRRRYAPQLDADAGEFISYAVEGAARMQNLIRAVLDYSRVGTHGQAFAPTDCAALVERTLETLRAQIAESGAHVAYDSLPTVYGDAGQLAQLFQNLIGNALKFHRPGATPQVTLAAERRDAEWELSVRDNGIGIDPAYAERVFAMFQRLHTRDEYAGTGIGLAVCKRIVERHGGRIWVESELGHGATVRFTLPATATAAAATTLTEHAA